MAAAAAALQNLGIEPEIRDPRMVLLSAVGFSHQMLEAVKEMVKAIPAEDIAAIGTPPSPLAPSSQRGARAAAFFALLDRWTQTAARTSKLALDANIDARMVHMAEQQATMITTMVRQALRSADIPLELQGPFLDALALEFKLFSTPGAKVTAQELALLPAQSLEAGRATTSPSPIPRADTRKVRNVSPPSDSPDPTDILG